MVLHAREALPQVEAIVEGDLETLAGMHQHADAHLHDLDDRLIALCGEPSGVALPM